MAFGQDALRQRSDTRGLNLGLYGQYVNWGTTDEDYKDLLVKTKGPGVGLRIGLGLSHRIELFSQVDASYLTTNKPDIASDFSVTLVHLEAGGRLNIGATTSRFRPFIDVGYSLVGAIVDPVKYGSEVGTANLYGRGILLGGGINYFLAIPFAINLRYSGVIGRFNSINFEDETITNFGKPDIGVGRASLGLTWYLRGRR